MSARILIGDCRERLKDLPDASVDSVVCDPPYHLTSIVKRFGSPTAAPAKVGKTGAYARASKGFMGQTWDGGDVAFDPDTWAEVLRVLKPGGHLVAFSGTRTYHRMVVAIEDAGFEVRDQLAWVYGSGFPKSLDVSKAIDKQRDDSADGSAVGTWLKAQREARGFKQKEVAALWPSITGGLTGCVANWETLGKVPKWDQWLMLKEFIGFGDEMDAEVWRLNGRKGQPGEAWHEREVVDVKTIKQSKGLPGDERDAKGQGMFAPGEKQVVTSLAATEAAQQWQGWGTALKPSWESIALAQKPYDLRQLCGILAHTITEAVCQLPSLAKDAEPSSWLSLSVSAEGFGSAQWSAVVECNTPGALCALMATLQSGSDLPLSLSTASSWLNTLAAILALENTFTTETASSLTTDLRTLKSLLSKNTPTIIARAAIPEHGEPCAASLAASLFSAVSARLHFIRGASVLDPATLKGDDWDILPSLQPICLARKPLVGSVASNVLTHGTGALNIDGCRIEGESTERHTFKVMTSKGAEGGAYGKQDHEYADREEKLGTGSPLGRWPANLITDGSDEVLAGFPETAQGSDKLHPGKPADTKFGQITSSARTTGFADGGSAARFFYCAKATTEERNAGLDSHEIVSIQVEWGSEALKAKLRVDMAQYPPKVIAVSDAPSKNASEWNTLLFGSESEGRSLSGCKSITRTAISSTTQSKTLSFLARSITSVSIAAANSEMESGGSPAETAESSTPSVTITSGETVFIPGVGIVPSGTPLRISVSAGVSTHPTVKPVALMRWLCRLVTPKGGTVLDPFMGSGSTGLAADAEQFNFIGCEMSPEYAAIAERRMRDAAGMFADVRIAA